MSLIIRDDFLPTRTWESLRDRLDTQEFSGQVNPLDGVFYPDISLDMPEDVLMAVRAVTGDSARIFMRRSLRGTPCPHQAHTDTRMGRWSLMLYLSREQHCQGGTSLVRHIATGMTSDPSTEQEYHIWQRDMNTPSAWEVRSAAEMRPNRAVVFPAKEMHRAEPVGGFGTSSRDGRIVLTAFFG